MIGSFPRARMSRTTSAASRAYRAARVLLGRIRHVHHVMRDAALLLGGHFVGADVEAAIDGRRIATDDLAAVVARPAPGPGRSCRTRSARESPGRAGDRSGSTDQGETSRRQVTYAVSTASRITSPRCWGRVGIIK